MVQAWFMKENWTGDQREEHHMQPPEFVDLDTLFKLTLVEHFKVCKMIKSMISQLFLNNFFNRLIPTCIFCVGIKSFI